MRRQISAAVAGMAGDDQDGHDPQHLEGVAQDGVDLGPGSIFQGSAASSSALARR